MITEDHRYVGILSTTYTGSTADMIDAEEDARHAEAEWLTGWRFTTERADYLPTDD